MDPIKGQINWRAEELLVWIHSLHLMIQKWLLSRTVVYNIMITIVGFGFFHSFLQIWQEIDVSKQKGATWLGCAYSSNVCADVVYKNNNRRCNRTSVHLNLCLVYTNGTIAQKEARRCTQWKEVSVARTKNTLQPGKQLLMWTYISGSRTGYYNRFKVNAQPPGQTAADSDLRFL